MKKYLFFFYTIVLFSISVSFAQEINCRVQISHPKIQGTNVEVFRDMQKDINEFLNNQQWTDHVYEVDERIECTFMITLNKQIGTERFVGTLSVQSRRPVYNTSYYTTLFNYKELDNNFQFEYRQQEPLSFKETQYSSLTSTLGFYVYLILGLDYDSFAPNGGSKYFNIAQQIVDYAQNARESGWKSYENNKMNNRFWLIENYTNEAYSDIHQFQYKYHRKGFDLLSDDIDQGRAEVAKSLEHLRNIYRKKPTLVILQLLLTAKSEEIIKLFAKSFPREQADVYNIMTEIDPANTSKYKSIKGGE